MPAVRPSCFFCGVSFQIGRIRTREERQKAAWPATTSWFDSSLSDHDWVGGIGARGLANYCSTKTTGCYLFHRGGWDPYYGTNSQSEEDGLIDDGSIDDAEIYRDTGGEDDVMYTPETDSEEDHSEWEGKSSAGLVEGVAGDEDILCTDGEDQLMSDAEDISNAADMSNLGAEDQGMYSAFLETLQESFKSEKKKFRLREGQLTQFNIPPQSKVDEHINGSSMGEFEHIAGPQCNYDRGYNGHRIHFEEMQGCRTVQVMSLKNDMWRPGPDDCDFEREGKFCALSDLTDNVSNLPPTFRALNSAQHNRLFTARSGSKTFHPWCFEIFIRRSRQRFGRIDTDGLMKWAKDETSRSVKGDVVGAHFVDRANGSLSPAPWPLYDRDQRLQKQSGKRWRHAPGTEYLSANPSYIPGLINILNNALRPEGSVRGQENVFDLSAISMRTAHDTMLHDPFTVLSPELRLAILERLDGQTIASLRLVSRAFRQLPQSLFEHLVHHDLPSLWEAAEHDDRSACPTSYFWARITRREKYDHDKKVLSAKMRFDEEVARCLSIVRDELPELTPAWEEAKPDWDDISRRMFPWPPPPREPQPPRLHRGSTDWHRLYCDLMAELNRGGLKGLRNRERIWRQMDEVVDGIEEYRDRVDVDWEVY